MHQVGEEILLFNLGSSSEQTRVTTWYPRPPGQTRMKYDGASSEGSDSASKC